MSGLGLDHVFPFPRDNSPPSSDTEEAPEVSEGEAPFVVVHSSEDASTQRSPSSRTASGEWSGPLSHVFPWQRTPTPPPFVQMQVFEPFEIGDLTPTPSEWSDGQYPSAQPSPETWRKEAGLSLDRARTPTSAPQMTPQLRALAEPGSDMSPNEDLITTPIAERRFISLDFAADQLQSIVADNVAKEQPASQAPTLVEDAQAEIDIPTPTSDRIPAALFDQAISSSHLETSQEELKLEPSAQFSEAQSSEAQPSEAEPSEAQSPPSVPISRIANRYMLYDTSAISFLRREYNICGVLIGTLPSHPQQNVFLGTPLELMPEEARRLVEVGAAHIVDDAAEHKAGIMGLTGAERKAFLRTLEKQADEAQRANQKKADDIKKEAMKKNADKIEKARRAKQEKQQQQQESVAAQGAAGEGSEASLFAPPSPLRSSSPAPSEAPTVVAVEDRYHITPSTSHPPLPTPPTSPPAPAELPKVPRSYPLFAYLHSRGYFMSPGLRFGCQYCVYPGDPLRYHSHFLASGMGWDDEFDLMQLVGGGRLGTGVKKGFLIGGKEKKAGVVEEKQEQEGGSEEGVRAFSIEWSGM